MTSPHKKHLSPEQIAKLSSAYLSEGKKDDVWEIADIVIEDKTLTARIRMRSYYTSPSDKGGFHLTPFSALEFLSQLMIILGHVCVGFTEKTRETWMLESSISCKRAIRNAENINVRMTMGAIKKIKDSMITVTKSQVYDENGLFEATLKAVLH